MDKIYINITNRCQYRCPFCCMYSSPANDIDMDFGTFQKIMQENSDRKTIVQFEGGEPLLHPLLFLFLEYCTTLEYVDRIIIDTNGAALRGKIDKIVEIAERNRKHITIKPSINSYILNIRKDAIREYDNISSACEFLEYVDFDFNIRYMDEVDETHIMEELSPILGKNYFKYSKYSFNRYGRAKDDKDLPELQIKEIYKKWKIYSSDGICFGTDLIARSIHEKEIAK